MQTKNQTKTEAALAIFLKTLTAVEARGNQFFAWLEADNFLQKVASEFWKIVATVNFLAAIALVWLGAAALDLTDQDLLITLAFLLLTLAVVTTHSRAAALELLLLEIDQENDRRDNQASTHIEVVLQDVQWLVRRELARNQNDDFDDHLVRHHYANDIGFEQSFVKFDNKNEVAS